MSSEHYYGRVAAGERPGNNSSMQLWSATSGARTATATATAATFPAATTSIIGGEGTASTTARTPDADAMFNDAALLLNAAARASREVSAAAPPGIASGAKHQPKNDEGKAEATRVVSMINGFPHELYAILPDAKTMVKVRIKVRVDIVGLPIFTHQTCTCRRTHSQSHQHQLFLLPITITSTDRHQEEEAASEKEGQGSAHRHSAQGHYVQRERISAGHRRKSSSCFWVCGQGGGNRSAGICQ